MLPAMTSPVSPLAPLRPDPSQKRRKDKAGAKTIQHRLLVPLVIMTVVAAYLASAPLLVVAAVVWVGWAFNYILITRVLQPDGGSTPSVNQHSNIETMEVRGEYRKAAAAYKNVIESSPDDVVACEKLGQLALRELKDYELAIWAYRQADRRRAGQPARQLGYAMLIAGIYRDNIGDAGKTMVELRRTLERFPNAPNTAQLRAELEELRTRHFEAP